MLRHLWHAAVLTSATLLLLELLIVKSLLLLFLCHVSTMRSLSRHSCRWLRHRGNVVWRRNIVAIINAIFASSRFRSIQASLDEVLAFSFGDEWLKFGCCECVDKTSFRDDQKEDLSTGEHGEFVGLETGSVEAEESGD